MEPIAAVGSPISGSQENGGNVTQPRAADDFPVIRARMEELRRERARPRAADDFRMIRAGGGGDMDYPYDLGPYSRKVTTTSADAQRWFDRGLNWCFGYHHEEA